MENWKTVLFILIAMMCAVLGLLYIPQIMSGTGLDISGTAVMTGIGLIGVVMFIVAPIMFLDFWTREDYAEAIVYAMLLLILGATFIVAWLWSPPLIAAPYIPNNYFPFNNPIVTPPPIAPPTPPSTPPDNLGIIPDNWSMTYGANPQIIFLDTGVEHNGNPSLRLEMHTGSDVNTGREIDGSWYEINAGDNIVITVWVKTTVSGLSPDPSSTPGARIGIDYYGSTSVGYGILYQTSSVTSGMGRPDWWGEDTGKINAWWIPWNTDWTQIGWNVTVPSGYYSYVNHGGSIQACSPHQIDSFVCWFDAHSTWNSGYAYFSDCELYINP